jgi:hypothetical protein
MLDLGPSSGSSRRTRILSRDELWPRALTAANTHEIRSYRSAMIFAIDVLIAEPAGVYGLPIAYSGRPVARAISPLFASIACGHRSCRASLRTASDRPRRCEW